MRLRFIILMTDTWRVKRCIIIIIIIKQIIKNNNNNNKFDASRRQILRIKCTKFDFGWAPPQTPLRELTALPSPDPLAGFKGAYF